AGGRRDADDPGDRGRRRGEEGTGRPVLPVGGGQAERLGRPQRQAKGGRSARDRPHRQVIGVPPWEPTGYAWAGRPGDHFSLDLAAARSSSIVLPGFSSRPFSPG